MAMAKAANGDRGFIHGVETFGAVDGPGLRYVLFTSGCEMRCLYCHNPDSWKMRHGEERTVDEVVADIGRYANFYRRTGGLTVSGGEPLVQADFVGDIFRRAKGELGLHTALDTNGTLAGHVPDAWFDPVDLVLLDIKHPDPVRHRELTGLPLQPTLDCARRLQDLGKAVWIRHVLVPGHTDAAGDVERLGELVSHLANVERLEILPFHKMGESKWAALGLPYRLGDTPVPGRSLLERVRRQLSSLAVPVLV